MYKLYSYILLLHSTACSSKDGTHVASKIAYSQYNYMLHI